MVTGASRGLGRAIALGLGASGANVVVNYREQADRAEEVVDELRRYGVEALAVRADAADPAQVEDMRTLIERDLGPVDVLVNNAGAIPRPGAWDEISHEALQETLTANLTSTMNCVRIFAPGMIERHTGRIVNVASTYGIKGAAPVMAYTAAKAGVINVTYSMARELGRHNVTVNCVCPGNFDTDMATEAGPGFIEWVESTTPLGRLGRPEELADAVVFLARSDFVTGSVLVVDGGHSLN